ncbi:MAG: RNA polymerase sigma factor, partial [Lachnospiraceae bacterium]|nr:RNA polymerase sigma factor [Lachnospiraceae bacterium]
MNNINAEWLITEYGASLYSFCLYLTRNREAAEDLYQQTFLVVLEKDELDAQRNPKAYLVTVAHNLWRNQIRKSLWRKKIAEVSYVGDEELENIRDNQPDVEEMVEKKELEKEVRRCTYLLPDKFRVVIVMHFMEDMSLEEIASALGIPVGTVKSRMNKAKQMLK